MAPRSILLLSLFLLSYFSDAKTISKPQAFSFPIIKDRTTHQYYTTIQIGSNSTAVNVVIDLSGRFLWFNSPEYFSAAASYRPIPCGSRQCAIADAVACTNCSNSSPVPRCTNDMCSDYSLNPFTGTQGYGSLGQDSLLVYSTSGVRYTVRRFPFQFSDPYLINGLGASIRGALGLGRTRIALQAQLASAFSFRQKFVLCIPSSGDRGNMIVGRTAYRSPFQEITKSLFRTPLIRNPISTFGNNQIGNLKAEYFIGLKSISVGSQMLSLNKTLLSIDSSTGGGGMSIQTVRPFTSLERSIYEALIKEFVKAAGSMNITSVKPVVPFGACFDPKTIGWSKTGPVVPTIDFGLQGKNAYWRLYGSNSMVSISTDVICLAFVEEAIPMVGTSTSVVVGGHQLENYVLEFDEVGSRFRFSSSLLVHDTSCAQFGA